MFLSFVKNSLKIFSRSLRTCSSSSVNLSTGKFVYLSLNIFCFFSTMSSSSLPAHYSHYILLLVLRYLHLKSKLQFWIILIRSLNLASYDNLLYSFHVISSRFNAASNFLRFVVIVLCNIVTLIFRSYYWLNARYHPVHEILAVNHVRLPPFQQLQQSVQYIRFWL